MANLTITAADVRPVVIKELMTAEAAEAITAGQAVRLDTTTGLFTKANATVAAEARVKGVALESAAAGQVISIMVKGILTLGAAMAALTQDDDVFLSDTDGTLADAAGTVPTIVGQTVPGFQHSTTDKLLRVDL